MRIYLRTRCDVIEIDSSRSGTVRRHMPRANQQKLSCGPCAGSCCRANLNQFIVCTKEGCPVEEPGHTVLTPCCASTPADVDAAHLAAGGTLLPCPDTIGDPLAFDSLTDPTLCAILAAHEVAPPPSIVDTSAAVEPTGTRTRHSAAQDVSARESREAVLALRRQVCAHACHH